MKIGINDLNPELYYFWRYAQIDSEKLAREVMKFKRKWADGQALFDEMLATDVKSLLGFERAVRFFVLNRITFSGVVEAGGYSQQALESRFTVSSIERVAGISKLLEGVKITGLEYNVLLADGGSEVFTFLDPPYFRTTQSRLYGRNGVLHTEFDHDEFAREMKECRHSWLITYDDSPEVRRNFEFANITEWQLQYGMNKSWRIGENCPGFGTAKKTIQIAIEQDGEVRRILDKVAESKQADLEAWETALRAGFCLRERKSWSSYSRGLAQVERPGPLFASVEHGWRVKA